MPITRSNSNLIDFFGRHPTPKLRPPPDPDVIVVSSDDEGFRVPRKRHAPGRTARKDVKGKSRVRRPPRPSEDVVEISSDDESLQVMKELRALREVRLVLPMLVAFFFIYSSSSGECSPPTGAVEAISGKHTQTIPYTGAPLIMHAEYYARHPGFTRGTPLMTTVNSSTHRS